jgi:hypothetical protein
MNILRHLFRIRPWLAAVLGFALLLGSISTQSIDLEEAQTWETLKAASVGEFFQFISSHPRGGSEMPLGLFTAWLWTHFAGHSEFGMWTVNLLWAGITLLALARVGRLVGIGWLPLLFAIQPFVWYSMDKAQNTVMQMAGGSLLLLGVVLILANRKFSGSGFLCLCLGVIIVCGANLFGLVVVFSGAIGLLLQRVWGRLEMTRNARLWIFSISGILIFLVGYWLAVLWRGEGPLRLWPVTPLNLAYIFYEFLGFQGLGPGKVRMQMIASGNLSVVQLVQFLPLLALLAASYLAVIFAAYKGWLTRPWQRVPSPHPYLHSFLAGLGVPGFAMAIAFLFSVATGFVFWGRHLAAAFPFLVLAIAFSMCWAGDGLWRKWGRIGCIGLWALLVVSSISVRFAPWNAHIDYRAAVAEAKILLADDKVIWWFADKSAAQYYSLPLVEPQDPLTGSGAVLMANEKELGDSMPDAIFVSRPENYDRFRLARKIARTLNASKNEDIHGFQIWEINDDLPQQ